MSDDSTPSLPSAQVIAGRYEVLGLLGVGGMGAVYKVRDRELDEVIALKMLKREIASGPGIVDRFRREVKLARRVTHPNVARTYDLGEHAGERFLTMELVEGETLAARIARDGQLQLVTVIEIASAICAGLEAAHAAGVVHRDLKPENILLSEGRVVIMDFGIARAQEAGAAARTAVPVGTPAYMAPEQVEASPDVDARADIYALGAMLFELLTAHLPFEADSVFAVAAMRLTQPPPDPREYRADLPEAIAQLVQKCMARKPADRFQSVREVASRLASLTMPAMEALAPSGEARNAGSEITDASQKTVAVLPIRNAGPPADDYLVDGLTDDLIDALSMTPGLRVRPRGVVMQMKNASSDPRTLGRELNVQVVVDGTMRTSADAIRVSARVLSVEDGFQIWAKRFDGTRADVLRIGDEAAREVAAALAVRKPTRAALVTDPLAIDLYLRGRHEFLKFWAQANERAIHLMKQAFERAPNDGLIMAGYAAALARQYGVTQVVTDHHDNALTIAEAAVRLAPQLAESHVALANVRLHDPDPVAAAAGVVRALALAPLSPDAHELRARLLVEVAEPMEAMEASRRAMQLEPRFAHLRYVGIGRAVAELGDWEELERTLGDPPDDPDTTSLYWLAQTRFLMWKRAPAEAAAMLERALAVPPFPTLPLVRDAAEILAAGKLPESRRDYLRDRGRTAPTRRMRSYWCQLAVEMQCYVGELGGALADLENAVALGLFDIAWMDRCPLLAELRPMTPFIELRKIVAERAHRVLIELHGGEATMAG